MTTEMKLFDHLELPYKDGGDDWLIICPWCASEKMSVGKSEGNIYQCWKCKESGNALTLTRKFYEDLPADRKSTRLNSSHVSESRMPSSA